MARSYFYNDANGNQRDVDADSVSLRSDGNWYDNKGNQCQPRLDGYVEGTAGNDLIDYNYTGDPEGDKIDHNDAILPDAAKQDDCVLAGAGDDTVLAGMGNDKVFGGTGNDSLSGHDGNDTLYGDAGNDVLSGDAGNNVSYGGAGDDRFVGGVGADTFDGGSGQDNLDYSASAGPVSVNLTTSVLSGGDAANDNISGGIDGVIGSAYADSLTGYDQQGTGAGDTFTNQFWGNAGNDTITGMGGSDLIYGGHDQDLIYGGTGNDTVSGDAGNDAIYGGNGSDLAYGGDNHDLIDTSGSLQAPDIGYPGLYPADSDPNDDKDAVYGGAGEDTIRTGDDRDWIDGGSGNDSIDVGVDNDTVSGGDGNDTIVGAEGADSIDGGAGNDLIYGGYGPGVPDAVNIPDATDLAPNNGLDSIHGGDGNDTIFGMDDNDTLFGDAGNDALDGGIDNDQVYGGTGNDNITGGQGADSLYGGDDRDLFVGGSAGDSADGGEGGNDHDTLDLTGTGPFKIVYDPSNPENGVVNFLDPTSHAITGSLTFQNIENVIPCFTPGTLIATPRGEVAVEDLAVGDKIITRDNGMQEIRWLGRRELTWNDLASAPHLKPVLIGQGALGNGLPERDMLVSPNHRLLVANDRTALYFDEHEVLVAAKHLVAGKGVHSVDAAGACYIHFMCDRHEVVLSNGAWTESFQPGDYTLKGMGNAQRSEIYDLFPELKTEAGLENYSAARRTLKRHEALLITR